MMIAHLFSLIYGITFILIGFSHLREPQKFVDIVPSYLPYALFLVYLTGIMEIAGGIGIIYPETRVVSGRLLAIFLIAVFPANIYMWTHDVAFNGTKLTTAQHILRSFLQIFLIFMALFLSGDLTES
jgi:uncharacterized membrane protein|tara:strand:- start:727 stop:1107 length:381 start_codon:yes stop_codon:yes gene_type:complete